MKRVPFFLLFLILALMHQAGNAASNARFPEWIRELKSISVKTFQTEVSMSLVNLPDSIEKEKSFMFYLKGGGSLSNVPDPLKSMERMFSTDGWIYVPGYQADGHGSASFAYEKENHLCNVHVNINSSCDDEETDHVPGEFWFEIYCRDKQ